MKNKKFSVINLIFLCALVAIFAIVPTINIIKNSNLVQDKFMGEVSGFQGVITVWNVDTFEGGSQNKTEFLNAAATKFSKTHNGLYFLIENITPEEMVNSFLNNVYPDVVSFGVGVQDVLKPLLKKLNLTNLPRQEVLSAGSVNGEVFAAGYLMGGYILASTSVNLAEAQKAADSGLLALTTSAGFDKKFGKKERHVSSVVLGENKYINTLGALEYFSNNSVVDYHTSPTMYDAYLDFVSYNKGTILFGTHRDLYKLSGKIKVGGIEGAIINYLEGYTNLVQYIGVLKVIDEAKFPLAEEFINYLLSDDVQKASTDVKMINTLRKTYYEEGEFKDLENAINKDLVIPNIFGSWTNNNGWKF